MILSHSVEFCRATVEIYTLKLLMIITSHLCACCVKFNFFVQFWNCEDAHILIRTYSPNYGWKSMVGLTYQLPIFLCHPTVIRSSYTWHEPWIPLGFISSNYSRLPPHAVFSVYFLFFSADTDISSNFSSNFHDLSILIVTVCFLGSFMTVCSLCLHGSKTI